MSKPEQAHEPTMEEILASIRRIISDDAQDESVAEEAVAPEEQPMEAMEESAAEMQADEDVLELTEEISTEEAEQIIAAEAAEPFIEHEEEEDLVFQDKEEDVAMQEEVPAFEEEFEPEPEPEPEPEYEPAAMSLQPEALASAVSSVKPGLMSAAADASVASAFSSLENFVLSTHSRTLEDLVSEMLKPLLKGWLDSNLPPLVERLVREEIERVTRGRR